MLKSLVLAVSLTIFATVPGLTAELIMLEEHGCPWCEKWNAEVGTTYAKTPEGKRAPLRRLNIHERLPDDLRFLDKGRYTPTFILVSDGREFGRIRGYPGEDFFWGYLGNLLNKLPVRQGSALGAAGREALLR